MNKNKLIYNPDDSDGLKHLKADALRNSFERFVRTFHYHIHGNEFMLEPFHRVMFDTIDRVVVHGDISRLIVSISPGMGKTQLCSIYLMAFGLAINPRSKYIHASYSSELATTNSQAVRDIIKSEAYRDWFGASTRNDKDMKADWALTAGGGLYSTSMMGRVTGYRAGYPIAGLKHFRGLITIDDPQKTSAIHSPAYRKSSNEVYNTTFASRLAQEDVPVIIIQQRLHPEDLSAFLLSGGSGEQWHHLCLPAIIPEEPPAYPAAYTHGIEIPHGLEPGPLWPEKLDSDRCRQWAEADPYTYSAQYLQQPMSATGEVIKRKWLDDNLYDVLPTMDIKYGFITGDTAQKTANHNDYSCFQYWGATDTDIYLIDQIWGKWEITELIQNFEGFYKKCKDASGYIDKWGVRSGWYLRAAYIEDKSSGTSLVQASSRKAGMTIVPVPRGRDKLSRVYDAVPALSTGRVHLPADSAFTSGIIQECCEFSATDSHKHDDRVDTLIDAVDVVFQVNPDSLDFSKPWSL